MQHRLQSWQAVQILSYTFTTINDDAAAESMFRHAVSTIEGNFLFLLRMLHSMFIQKSR
jgi:hypothetical protein